MVLSKGAIAGIVIGVLVAVGISIYLGIRYGSPSPKKKYACNSSNNTCVESDSGTYDTLSDCQNSCKPASVITYNCDSTLGCSKVTGPGGTFADKPTCQSKCQQLQCNATTGTCTASSTSYTNVDTCNKSCTTSGVITYNCDPTQQCVKVTGQGGTFPDKTICEAKCQQLQCNTTTGKCSAASTVYNNLDTCSASCTASGGNTKNMVGAYIPSWAYYRAGSGKYPSNYSISTRTVTIPNLPSKLDFITYAFVLFDSNGNLNWGPNINVFNPDGKTINTSPGEYFDFDMVKYIGSLSIQYRIISVGGYNFSQTSAWSDVTGNNSSITNLVNQLITMCKIYNLTGVDIDWEYPQKGELDTFMAVAGPLFKSSNIMLTLAIGVNKTVIDTSYNFPNIDSYFSWYNLMSYDIYGNFPGSTTFGANTDFSYTKDTLNYLINTKNVSANKIALGLASYGRYTKLSNYDSTKSALGQAITLIDSSVCMSETGSNVASYSGYTADCLSGPYTKTVGYLSYYEIADLIDKTGVVPVHDPTTESTYVVLQKNGVIMAISFDTVTNITNKAKYALNNSLMGVFLWQLADDDFLNGNPISNTAISVMKNTAPPTLVSTRQLYDVGPCGVAWENNGFPVNTVKSCRTFSDPSTVGKGTLSCFGIKTCSAVYDTQCQISNSSSNLNYPPTAGGFVPFGDFLNQNCGNVFYGGATYGPQFYRDYVQTGRVKMCDASGNTVSFSPDCSTSTNVGACMSSSLETAPSKATICLNPNVATCASINLNCTQ